MNIRKPPKGEPYPEELILHKEKSLMGQVKKAQQTVERNLKRRLLGKSGMLKLQEIVTKQELILERYRNELIAKQMDAVTLTKRQPGYQQYGDFA